MDAYYNYSIYYLRRSLPFLSRQNSYLGAFPGVGVYLGYTTVLITELSATQVHTLSQISLNSTHFGDNGQRLCDRPCPLILSLGLWHVGPLHLALL